MLRKKFKGFWLGAGWLLIAVGIFSWSVYGLFRGAVSFNPELGINLVVVGENKMAILVLRPGDEPSSFVLLPSDLMVPAYATKGDYKVSKLWELADFAGVDGRVMVSESLADSLGVAVGGFVKVGNDELVTPLGVKAELLRPLLKTDLWWWDRWKIRQEIGRELAAFSLLESDLPALIVEKKLEADGLEALRLASESVIDSWGRRVWLMEQVLAENVQVEIYNHGDEAGKARQMARKLNNAGIGVLKVDKGEGKTKACVFETGMTREDAEKSFYLLESVFGCEYLKKGNLQLLVIRIGD